MKPITIANADEWIAAGWHGAGNAPHDKKAEAGWRHAVNQALAHRPQIIILGSEKAADDAAPRLHALGFEVWRCEGKGINGVYTYVGDQPENAEVRVIGEAAQLGQVRALGCEAAGESLEMTALQSLPGIGPKTAAAILEDGFPEVAEDWLPRCRGAEKVKAVLAGYAQALEAARLVRVPIRKMEGPKDDLRALGLGRLADRIESEPHVERDGDPGPADDFGDGPPVFDDDPAQFGGSDFYGDPFEGAGG